MTRLTFAGTRRLVRAAAALAAVLALVAGCGDAGDAPPAATSMTAAPLLAPTPTIVDIETSLDLDLIPNAAAPDGLGSLTLPGRAGHMAALFEHLPESALGATRIALEEVMTGPEAAWHPRCASGCFHVASYGSRAVGGAPEIAGGITAIDIIGISDFYPRDWGGGHVIADGYILQRQLDSQMSPGIAVTPPPLPDPDDGFAVGTWRDGMLIWGRVVQEVHASGGSATTPVYTIMFGTLDTPWIYEISADSSESAGALLAAFVAAATSSQ
jgi:hypothetical protein